MRIALVAINAKYIHSNLAVYNLQAYAADCKHSIILREYTINNQMDDVLQSLYGEKADVLAFSCYIWNIEYVHRIAREIKKVSPQTQIWVGGPEVSYAAREILEQYRYIDLVMCGEGERTMRLLAQGEDYVRIPGIVYREGELVVENKAASLMDLDEIPFVYKHIEDFENKIIYYESSRGCPFSCSYCLSSIDKSVRFRSLNLVFPELQFFLDHKVPQVKFVDRTFNCNREHADAIWHYITEHDNGITNFHFEVSADLITKDQIALFATMRPGLIQLEIGLQSTNEKTIYEIRRTMNLEKLSVATEQIRKLHNIHQHLDLIVGLPYEDYHSFQESFNTTYALQPSQLQLGFLKVLKGSYMETQVQQYGLVYHSDPPYEVMATNWITYDEVVRLKKIEDMVEIYYNSAQFRYTLEYLVQLFETPYAFYDALATYYTKNKYQGLQFKRLVRYDILRSFAREGCKEIDTKLLDMLLVYDLYLRENVKNRPDWAIVSEQDKLVLAQLYRENGTGKQYHIEAFPIDIQKYCLTKHMVYETTYLRFDYQQRNELTKDATIIKLAEGKNS